MKDDFDDWDAAYLLGALSAADRRAYELHLRACGGCRDALAEFVPLPGILSHLSHDEALGLLETPEERAVEASPPALLSSLAAATASARRRTRLKIAGLVLAAAGVSAAAAVALPMMVAPALQSVETASATVALAGAPGVPVEATVEFVSEEWGTRIDMDCTWGAADGETGAYAGGVGYVMYVTDTSGETAPVGSWTSTPGSTVHPTLATGLSLAEIAAVEVRVQGSGTVVLTGAP
ncbi:anti-sigma factor [Rathayibacter sp. VKM Ac-2803]|uniref:anti-sigma factor family protein n=1 Tax=Rathayibacter sp. VKM Ac-2803 TaxID=2609256 RepID=UPI001356C5AE|nr:zf-HC2 domain-containing protein [Rathayibacter sp. VKM Ac-2803]MWV50685.1 anti-sigma factor [Rathayibacter sp. VKM Ac-2803]